MVLVLMYSEPFVSCTLSVEIGWKVALAIDRFAALVMNMR